MDHLQPFKPILLKHFPIWTSIIAQENAKMEFSQTEWGTGLQCLGKKGEELKMLRRTMYLDEYR